MFLSHLLIFYVIFQVGQIERYTGDQHSRGYMFFLILSKTPDLSHSKVHPGPEKTLIFLAQF
jgi:hypothetical protein